MLVEDSTPVAVGFRWCLEMFLALLVLVMSVPSTVYMYAAYGVQAPKWFLKQRNCGKYPLSS